MKLVVFGSHLYFVAFGITEPFADACLRVNDTKNTILCLAQLSLGALWPCRWMPEDAEMLME